MQESAPAQASKAAFQCCEQLLPSDTAAMLSSVRSHLSHEASSKEHKHQALVLPAVVCMVSGYVVCMLAERFFHPWLVHLNLSPVFAKTPLVSCCFRCKNLADGVHSAKCWPDSPLLCLSLQRLLAALPVLGLNTSTLPSTRV